MQSTLTQCLSSAPQAVGSSIDIRSSVWRHLLRRVSQTQINVVTILRLLLLIFPTLYCCCWPSSALLVFGLCFLIDCLYEQVVTATGVTAVLAESLDWVADFMAYLLIPILWYLMGVDHLAWMGVFLGGKFCLIANRMKFDEEILDSGSVDDSHRLICGFKEIQMRSCCQQLRRASVRLLGVGKKINSHFYYWICRSFFYLSYLPSVVHPFTYSQAFRKVRQILRAIEKKRQKQTQILQFNPQMES